MKTMKKIVAILAVALMLCSILPLSVFAADTYELASSIEVGDTVVLACTSKSMELSGISTTSTKYGLGVAYTGAPVGAYALTVEEGYTAGTYSFKCPNGQYLYWTSGNSLATNATKNANTSWTVTFSGDNAIIKNAKDTARQLQWNASSPRFACYGNSGQTAVQLFKLSGGEEPPVTCEHVWVDADCTTAKTCSLWGETEGEALGHSYGEATETVAPDCTNAGEMEYTCSACGDVKTETVNALGHTYVDGACEMCGEAQPLEVTIDTFADTGVLDGSTSISWTNGDFSVVNQKGSSSTAIRTSDTDHFRLYVGNTFTVSGGAMTKVVINCVSGYPINDSTNKVNDGWTVTANGTAITYTATNGSADELTITIGKQSRIQSVVITPYVEAPSDCEHDYVGVETQAPSCTVEGVTTYTCSKCGESYTEAIATIPHNYVEDIIDSTCTTTGTATYECSVCFHSYDETIPVKPHNYVDDVCDACGAVKAYKGTIDFSNVEQRTELTTQIQIWTNEGLTFTNNKLTGNNIADYTDPVRIYKNSGIVIEFPEMSKLIIDASGIGNDYLWDATLEAAGLSFTVESKIYTITFAEPVNSIELTAANQVRANSITAIVAHECVWADATCTAPKTCSKCGATEGEALGHTYFDACSAICDVCGYEREAGHNVIHVEAKDATCTELGNIEYWYCDVCGMAWLDEACIMNTNMMAVKLPMIDHTYDNDFDADCNACGAIREVEACPITYIAKSISEDVNGLAFLFNVEADGIVVKEGTFVQADFTGATYEGYKLLGVGAIASNGVSETNIEGLRMYDLGDGNAKFAFRVINIPADKLDVEITMTPYYVVEIDGVATTIEGEAVVGSYAEIAG